MYFCMTAKLSHNTVLFWKPDLFIFILCIWMFCVYLCLCTTHMLGIHGSQKRVSHPPGTGWMWVTMWVLGIELKPSERQPVLTNLRTIFPAPNFFLRVIHFYFMWMSIFCFLPVCYICVPHIYSSLKDQKRSLNPLELELETAVSFHVDAGSEKQLYS